MQEEKVSKDKNMFIISILTGILLIPFTAAVINVWILFAVMLLGIVLFRWKKEPIGITDASIKVCLYVASLILVLYFVEFGVATGIFPFFYFLSNIQAFGAALAVIVFIGAVWCYEQEEDKRLQITYIVMIGIAVLSVSVFDNCMAMIIMLFVPLLIVAIINPVAIRVKKILQCFFIEAFSFCNLSLLYNYVNVFHTQNVSYSLEVSVIGELLLAVFALYILHEWDKLPKDEKLSNIRLCTLQRRIRRILVWAIVLLAFIVILGWDMGVERENVKIYFVNQNREIAQTGIFTNVVLQMLYSINHACEIAIDNNLFGYFNVEFGFGVVMLAFIAYLLLGYMTYRYCHKEDMEWDLSVLTAVACLAMVILMPICIELLPFYLLFIIGNIDKYGSWKMNLIHKKISLQGDLSEDVASEMSEENKGTEQKVSMENEEVINCQEVEKEN